MKNINVYIIYAILLSITIAAFAEPPGGGYNGYRQFAALFDVDDENGDPVEGVDVKVLIQIFGTEGDNSTILYGTTNSQGWVNLSTTLYYFGYELGHSMIASLNDDHYTVTSSSNTSTTTSYNLYPGFDVIFDTDHDGLQDDLEIQIAEKFKPVLHRHAFDSQPGLQNFDLVLENNSSLKAYNIDTGWSFYNEEVPPIHVSDSKEYSDFCSFGWGLANVMWLLDFDNWIRKTSAATGSRPIYYHVYKNDTYYHVQYWYFFTFNDLTDDTEHETWHEGDWEHVSIKLENDNGVFIPLAVNFYQHVGGHSKTAYDCWWSSNNNCTYTGIQQGYDEEHTHLHIWIAANSHASYNRYDYVYDFTLDTILGIGEDHFIDNCDYDPTGWDFYFEYDHMEKLGEVTEGWDVWCHGQHYIYHRDVLGYSKYWLAFVGRMGDYWSNSVTSTPSPNSPATGDISHEYYAFSTDYGYWGFGNDQQTGDSFFSNGTILWLEDPTSGD